MSQQLTGYRVFIASPGGLSSARDCFRRVLEEYNRTDGFRRGVVFIPVGWEKMAPTRGRGQEVINQRLRQCDCCVLVLRTDSRRVGNEVVSSFRSRWSRTP